MVLPSTHHPTRPVRAVIPLVAFGVCLLVGLFELAGLPSRFDHLTYDALLSCRSSNVSPPTSVVLVYCDADTFEREEQFARLSRKLRALEPRCVGICEPLSFAPPQNQPGESLVWQSSDHREFNSLKLVPEQSVYRRHFGGDSDRASLEWQIARTMVLPSDPLPAGRFHVRYRGSTNSLPHFTSAQVLDGALTSEVIGNKAVLLGLRPKSHVPGVATPTTGGTQMTTLELRGHIVNTLLSESWVSETPASLRLIIAVLFILLACLGYQRFTAKWMLSVCLLTTVSLLAVSFVLLHFGRLWFPITSVTLGHSLCCAMVLERRLCFLNEATSRLALHRELAMEQSVAGRDAWESVAAQLQQLFFPQKLVLMELPTGATHLVIRRLLDCDETDIFERRRDSRRTPYLSATEIARPYVTSDRTFFVRGEDSDDLHVVVPFLFAGELLGFATLEFPASVASDRLLDQLHEFSAVVSARLAEYRQLQQSQPTTLARLLRGIPEEQTVLNILRTDELARHRQQQLESLLEGTRTGLAMYDSFGRIVAINSSYRREMQTLGFVAHDLSASQIIAAITSLNHHEAREAIRTVSLGGRSRAAVTSDGAEAVVYLHPLKEQEHQQGLLIEIVPFDPLRERPAASTVTSESGAEAPDDLARTGSSSA